MTAPEDTTPPRLDELISTREACERHGLMTWDLSNAVRAGKLTPYRLPGGRKAYRITDVDAWAKARKAEHNAACMESTPEGAP